MPGGVCRDLSPKALAEVARRWPEIDPEEVNSAAKYFQIRMQHTPETPASLRMTMDKLVETAVGLRVALLTLSEEAADHLRDDFAATRQVDLFEGLPAILDRLKAAAMRGHNAEVGKDGRDRRGAKHQLVGGLAWQLQKAGIPRDARKMGDLCLLADIVITDLKVKAHVQTMVRDALKQMGGGERSSGE